MSSIYGSAGIDISRSLVPGNTPDPKHLQLKIAPSSEIQALPLRVTNVETATSTLVASLAAKQNIFADGDLSIAKTNLPQSILDTKVEATQIYTSPGGFATIH